MERGWFLVGGGWAHCWVLKHQGRGTEVTDAVRCEPGGVGGDGCLDCVSGCSPLSRVPGWVCGGLVGLLFEICIVDASIN